MSKNEVPCHLFSGRPLNILVDPATYVADARVDEGECSALVLASCAACEDPEVLAKPSHLSVGLGVVEVLNSGDGIKAVAGATIDPGKPLGRPVGLESKTSSLSVFSGEARGCFCVN